MGKKKEADPPVVEPEEKILPPEAVEAAGDAVDEALERAEASTHPDRDEIIGNLLDVKGILNGIDKKIDKLGEVRAKNLTDPELAAVQLGAQSIAGGFLSKLDALLGGNLPLPEGLSSPGAGPGEGGGEADPEKGKTEGSGGTA